MIIIILIYDKFLEFRIFLSSKQEKLHRWESSKKEESW